MERRDPRDDTHLQLRAKNTEALTFHAAMGFAQVGLIPEAGHTFGCILDLALMQKRL